MFSKRSWVPRADGATCSGVAESSLVGGGAAEVTDLTQTNPTDLGLQLDLGLGEPATWPSVYEPESFGLWSARAAICEHHNADPLRLPGSLALQPEQLVLTASTSEAYGFLFKLLCDPGDVVLVPCPGYPLFDELARYEGVVLERYALRYDGAWYIDVDELRSRIDSRVRAVVVVTPNNPTGSCLRREELEQLMRLGVPLISDEVFSPYRLERRSDATSVLAAGERGLSFVLDGLSKRAALPQAKLAWIAVQGEPAWRMEALRRLEFIADAYLSVNGVVQRQAGVLLELSARRRQVVAARVANNLRRLDALLSTAPISRLDREGGWMAVLRLPNLRSEEEWLRCFADVGVRVQPGWFYDFQFGPLCVVSLLVEPGEFEAAVWRLVRAVEQEDVRAIRATT